jgi:mycofactocin precursor
MEVFRMNVTLNHGPLPFDGDESSTEEPEVIEEIEVEDLAVDGICGVY